MGTYKGNVGNLMQHWTLCALLGVAKNQVDGLNYVDAHSMSPWADPPKRHSHEFQCVQEGLPGQGSDYERAWHRIANLHPTEGYPSSAAFVHDLWNKP